QRLAALDRRAERLRQVAAHQYPVERRGDVGARELLVDQRELRARLVGLRADDARRGAIAPRHGFAVLAAVPGDLRGEAGALEPHVAVVEARQQLALLHRVAGAPRRLAHVALEWRSQGTLDLAFDARSR